MKRVLFVCVHNSGRSQMAQALFNHLARKRGVEAVAESAGTAPAERVNPVAAQAMAELGLSLEGHRPRLLTPELAAWADRMVTMGCGVDQNMCPAGSYFSDDWGLDDPAGQPIEVVRTVRAAVSERVEALLDEVAGEIPVRRPA
jgi:arsenate reductase (thioredoxin)